tara:strand:+ start:175 stop:630 length:456 start_codon:yes stop_codon:yes gene_type:complete
MRKKLSEERKQQLRDQLDAARKKKAPAEYKNVHPIVLAKPDDDPLSLKSIKKAIKHNKDKASSFLTNSRRRGASPKQSIADKISADGAKAYIRFMEHYLRTGDWISDYMGDDEEKKTQWKCVAMAYNPDGTPKRSKGVYYPDIGMVWGEVV